MLTNKFIESKVREHIQANKELELVIFEDGVWTVVLNYHTYGLSRYLVFKQYMHKDSARTICVVNDTCTGVDSEFGLKPNILKKILSTEKHLRKSGLSVI